MLLRILLLVLGIGGGGYYGYSQWGIGGIGGGLVAVGAGLLLGVLLYGELCFPRGSN